MRPGKLALLRFPHVDLEAGKLRPVLLLARVPGAYSDWLVAMVSSQLEQAIPELDEVIAEQDADFKASGLKKASVIRGGRLAVADIELLEGEIGEVSDERLHRIRRRIADWLLSEHEPTSDNPR